MKNEKNYVNFRIPKMWQILKHKPFISEEWYVVKKNFLKKKFLVISANFKYGTIKTFFIADSCCCCDHDHNVWIQVWKLQRCKCQTSRSPMFLMRKFRGLFCGKLAKIYIILWNKTSNLRQFLVFICTMSWNAKKNSNSPRYMITSKTKLNVFWKNFLHSRFPSGTLHSK